nr:beta-galactosidase 3-like [Tanacetum cinerariifolium]
MISYGCTYPEYGLHFQSYGFSGLRSFFFKFIRLRHVRSKGLKWRLKCVGLEAEIAIEKQLRLQVGGLLLQTTIMITIFIYLKWSNGRQKEKVNNMSEKMFESQGGPIIFYQVENEYGSARKAYGGIGHSYMTWAANMIVGLDTSIPWVMCKQDDAPDPVVTSMLTLSNVVAQTFQEKTFCF